MTRPTGEGELEGNGELSESESDRESERPLSYIQLGEEIG